MIGLEGSFFGIMQSPIFKSTCDSIRTHCEDASIQLVAALHTSVTSDKRKATLLVIIAPTSASSVQPFRTETINLLLLSLRMSDTKHALTEPTCHDIS